MAYEKKGYINEKYHYFHLRDCEGQELDFHYHEFDKLVILISGNVIYSVEHEDYQLKPWDILLVPHHTIHKATIDRTEPYDRIIIYFNRIYVRSLITSVDIMKCFEEAQKQNKHLLHAEGNVYEKMLSIIEEYEAITDMDEFGAEGYKDTLIFQLLIQVGRLHFASGKKSIVKYDDKIQDALSYIYDHLEEELTVDDIADYVHLSRSYFMHLFKEETGMTVHGSLVQKRLLSAAGKIRKGVPVNVAAMESGFSDYSTFYRSFKNAFGINPGEIKNK